MASINISEADFTAVAYAAVSAKRKGDLNLAGELDKIARKINAALSNTKYAKVRLVPSKALSWQDVPSTLDF